MCAERPEAEQVGVQAAKDELGVAKVRQLSVQSFHPLLLALAPLALSIIYTMYMYSQLTLFTCLEYHRRISELFFHTSCFRDFVGIHRVNGQSQCQGLPCKSCDDIWVLEHTRQGSERWKVTGSFLLQANEPAAAWPLGAHQYNNTSNINFAA